uniref:Uncharacterized protein n=1 Tax=Amphimedon queenslandica TaxID=400682 RepID=A0A1X7U1Y4_AMPQE
MKQNVLQLAIHLRGQNGRPTQPHLSIGPPQGHRQSLKKMD